MLKVFESALDAVKGVFDYAGTAKERQAETEIIREKRDLKKASDIAEEAFKLFFRYYDVLADKDKERLKRLYDDFLERN